MVQAEDEGERVAVVVGERNQARMASPTCHAGQCSRIEVAWQRTVDHASLAGIRPDGGHVVRRAIGDRLIGRPVEATP